MNHGNTEDKLTASSRLDRLNDFFGRLLGKKSTLKPQLPQEIPSNNRFILMLLTMVGALWLLTGIYYVPEQSYGIILLDGKVNKVVSGVAVGLSAPYPFSDEINLTAGTNYFSMGKAADKYYISSRDQHSLAYVLEVGYKINDPRRYYLADYQENANLDQQVAGIVAAQLQAYASLYSSQQLLHDSSIVIANEVRRLSQVELTPYGLALDKLNLISLQNKTADANAKGNNELSEQKPLPVQLLNQAYAYQADLEKSSVMLREQFMQLLPQYRANPSLVAEMLYYKLLSTLPAPQQSESFPLLKLSHEQFLAQAQSGQKLPTSSAANGRQFNRSVDRQRIFQEP